MRKTDERVLRGIGVSPGLAVGTAHVNNPVTLAVPEFPILEEQIPSEVERFEAAVVSSRHQLEKLKEKSASLHGTAAEELGFLLDAHLAMLAGSRLVRGVAQRIADERVNAEAAIWRETQTIAAGFAAMDDPYLSARAEDIRVVGDRVVRSLIKAPFPTLSRLAPGSILLSEELTPADTALLDPAKVGGFATVAGGADSHTAIMARALGLPAVLACGSLMDSVAQGDVVIIDGFAGLVTINPTPQTLAAFEAATDRLAREREGLKRFSHLPSITADGIPIVLQVNLELPRELEVALGSGAGGIGLLRTEFLFMNRDEPPSEDEQVEALLPLVRGMGQREVTIRTLDIGSDKLAFPIKGVIDSPNPALGLRAIRLGLRRPELLDAQLAAILRVAIEGPVRILLPMISSLSQIRRARQSLILAAERLTALGVRIPARLPPLGIMIEIPGAALAADAFARESAFFAIGTNDLTQYTLAIDRGDEQVADLYNPVHPAVLRLVQFTVEAAQRAGIPVSVCGELAGDPRYTALLLGLGVRALSMAPGNLTRVKQQVRELTISDALNSARRVMAESDEDLIAHLLRGADAMRPPG